MSTENIETVTMSLDSYAKMKDEIEYLKIQVKEKTIIVEVEPTWIIVLKTIALIIIAICLMFIVCISF